MKNLYKEELKLIMNLALEYRLSLKNICAFINVNPIDENQMFFYNELIKNANNISKKDELKYLVYETTNESENDSKRAYNLARLYYMKYLKHLCELKKNKDLKQEISKKIMLDLNNTDVEFQNLVENGLIKRITAKEATIIAKYRIKHVISKIQFAKEYDICRDMVSRWDNLITNPRLIKKINTLNNYNYEISTQNYKLSYRKK